MSWQVILFLLVVAILWSLILYWFSVCGEPSKESDAPTDKSKSPSRLWVITNYGWFVLGLVAYVASLGLATVSTKNATTGRSYTFKGWL